MRSHEDDSDSDLDLVPFDNGKSVGEQSENADDKSNISLDDNISMEEFDKTEGFSCIVNDPVNRYLVYLKFKKFRLLKYLLFVLFIKFKMYYKFLRIN